MLLAIHHLRGRDAQAEHLRGGNHFLRGDEKNCFLMQKKALAVLLSYYDDHGTHAVLLIQAVKSAITKFLNRLKRQGFVISPFLLRCSSR